MTVRFVVVALVAGLVAGGSSSVRADRPAVELVLSSMERAVLAGDPEAYLSHIDTTDPIFLKEQHNWARDLTRHVPTEFSLDIHQPGPAEQEEARSEPAGAAEPVFDIDRGEARFEMVMSWTIAGVGRGDQDRDHDRTVSYPVIFRRGEDGQWRYAGEDWVTIHSGMPAAKEGGDAAGDRARERAAGELSDAPNRARCFAGFEEVARLAVDLLPEVRAHVDREFENPIAHVQEVKIYPSMRHLQASIYLSYVDGLSGWNEPGESIKLLASKKASAAGLRTLLAHEYGHVATFEFGPKASDMPWWVLEGVAEQSAARFVARNAGTEDQPETYGAAARATVEQWARAGRLAPWDQIADFRSTPRKWGGHVYKQGQHMLGFITKHHGLAVRNRWLRALARGAGIDEATREVMGFGFEALDAAWRGGLPGEEANEGAAAGSTDEPATGDAPKER